MGITISDEFKNWIKTAKKATIQDEIATLRKYHPAIADLFEYVEEIETMEK